MTTAASTRVRPSKRLFALGGGALLLFAVGTNVQAGWVLVVAALLLGIIAAGIILPLAALRGVVVSRRVPARATAGDPLEVSLVVQNASRGLRGMFRVTDDFCGRGWAYVGAVGPGAQRGFAGTRTGARRGVHTSGTCVVATGAPFGVLDVRRSLRVVSPIVVYPHTYPLGDRLLPGATDRPASAATGDVSSVRDYRPGDPLRHVHWRSVAKRGRLVVREFDREDLLDAAVVARLPDDADAADAVASVACSFALAMVRGGDVQLIGPAGGDEDGRAAANGRATRTRSSDRVLEWGARLVPDGPALPELLAAVRGASVLVCVCDTASAGAAIGELVRLAGRASLQVILVARPGDDAAGVASQLRAGGVRVADVSPTGVAEWFERGATAR